MTRAAHAAGLALALGLSGGALAGDARTERFTSGGVPVVAEWFPGAGEAARKPAVLMLHGADGLSRAEQYRTGARAVAAAGYHVVLVHYLERTGDRWASLPAIFSKFPHWMETVRDAVGWVASRDEVDPERIGVIGVSLGAALTVAVAGSEPRIRAFVDYFGPLPEAVAEGGGRLPPTLVLHGAADPIVPVANAHAFERLLKAQGVPHEVRIYPGQGHGFHGEAQADAALRVVGFLDRHLKGGS